MALDSYSRRRIGQLLRVPHGAVVERIHRELARRGFDDLHPAHLVLFQHVDNIRGSRTSWLAERAQITKQSMGYLVDYLEQRGYVERLPDPDDGRAKLVRMTDRGWAVHEAAFEIVLGLEAEWEQEIGAERMQQLRTILADLSAVIEEA